MKRNRRNTSTKTWDLLWVFIGWRQNQISHFPTLWKWETSYFPTEAHCLFFVVVVHVACEAILKKLFNIMSDFWVITWTSGGFQILHDYNLILGNRLYLILSLLRHAVIRVLLALCSVCRQGETTKGCVCVVSILLPTVPSWYFIWSEHYRTGSSIPNQFRHRGASLSGRNGDRWNWKGWASLPDVGHLFCRRGAVRNLPIRYMFVLESFLFISGDSAPCEVHVFPPTFPSAFI